MNKSNKKGDNKMKDQDLLICELQHKETELKAEVKALVKVKDKLFEILSLAKDPTHNPQHISEEISLIEENEIQKHLKSKSKKAVVELQLEYEFDGRFSTEEIIDKLNNEANQEENLPSNFKKGSFKVVDVQRFHDDDNYDFEYALTENIRRDINE